MKKLLQITTVWMMCISIIYGQNKKPLSMEEAVQTALDSRTEYQVNKLREQIAGKQTEVARYGKIPKIYGDYDLQRNLIIPTTPVPSKAFDPDAPAGELTPLQFSTKWTSGAGVNASIDLFNPALEGQISELELQEDLSKTETKITENKLKYEVRSAYVSTLIAQEQWRLAVADTISKHQLLEMAILQYDGGRINDIQINTVRNTLTQTKVTCLNALKIYEASKIDLYAEMGLDPSEYETVFLTDTIPNWLPHTTGEMDVAAHDLNLKKIIQQQSLNRLQAENLRKAALPTVTLSGFLGTNYYENNLSIWKGDHWYGNSYLKVGIHIPITEEMDRHKKIEVLDLKRAILEQNFTGREKEIQKEQIKIRQNLQYAEKSYLLQEKRMRRSEENYEQSVRQFDAGRVLIKDVIESDFQYLQARSDYLQALYDDMKAKIEWLRLNEEL